MSSLIDISPLISEKTAVFPGDQNFLRTTSHDIEKEDNLTLSSISTTVHIGAHADAPIHYKKGGESIHERSLDYYYGKCQVITVNVSPNQRIFPQDIQNIKIKAPRVLFRTNSFPNPNKWTPDFVSLSPELIEQLAQQGVKLLGIDTPSIDPANSKALESHNVVAKYNMAILEGIVLTETLDTLYTLVAFPLKIQGADASPVRAVLMENPHHEKEVHPLHEK